MVLVEMKETYSMHVNVKRLVGDAFIQNWCVQMIVHVHVATYIVEQVE